MKIGLVVIMFALILGGCAYLNQKFDLPNDNVAEQAVEELIEHEVGIEVDLTPEG